MIKLVRQPQVTNATGKSRSALYAEIAVGLFSKPVKLGKRCVAWPSHEISALNAARIAGKTDDEIRALVTQLEAERKQAA